MSVISTLSPSLLWEFFDQICAIPHPSYHERALSLYLMARAEAAGIAVEKDDVGNLLFRKPATAGMENKQSVVLQAHLDMVAQKNDATVHDFTRDPILPRIEGEWVCATGTTLGADNGIGMASALAVLFDPAIKHGPIEVLLTTTEEAGMEGAFGLKPNWLQSQLLINTDSETEGEVYVGCAGGVDFKARFPLLWQPRNKTHMTYQLALTGLKGGHSGIDIDKHLGCANVLLIRYLFQNVTPLSLELVSLKGGTLRNAISREAYVTFTVDPDKIPELETSIDHYLAHLRHEFSSTEPALVLTLMPLETAADRVINGDNQAILIHWLYGLPHGVMRVSDSLKGVVETSLNFGLVEMTPHTLDVTFLIRSLVDEAKETVVKQLITKSQSVNAHYVTENNYPGWQPDVNSLLLTLVNNCYAKLYDKIPATMVIHAGLECGLFKNSYPLVDMISIGPTIVGAHSPSERVHIDGVLRYWSLLTETLSAVPDK